ncbi:hypothetical protein [Actinoplanes aureus]|uniref:Uncharacterized protein n=1 Tax=Actinoplanes aureus TaxID=2792083 RepID=A0A931CG69_9ACTN|nr:hypothetical protein [Actinoplanes aureus]MBG0566631.1 hypothetical protein [Actinoplanes aureus]
MGLVRLQRFLLALGMVIAVGPPAPPVVAADGPTATQTTDSGLWSSTVARYLADPLWRDDEAYNAGHVLQVPLHAAFARQRADRMGQSPRTSGVSWPRTTPSPRLTALSTACSICNWRVASRSWRTARAALGSLRRDWYADWPTRWTGCGSGNRRERTGRHRFRAGSPSGFGGN